MKKLFALVVLVNITSFSVNAAVLSGGSVWQHESEMASLQGLITTTSLPTFYIGDREIKVDSIEASAMLVQEAYDNSGNNPATNTMAEALQTEAVIITGIVKILFENGEIISADNIASQL